MFDTIVIDNETHSNGDGPRGYEVYALDEGMENNLTGAQIRARGRLIAEKTTFDASEDFPITTIKLDKAVYE